MKIGRKFTLEAAHQLPDDEEVYGACTRPHGHSYKLEVTVEGPVDKHGWVINFRDLKRVVREAAAETFEQFNGLHRISPTWKCISTI